MKIGIDLKPFFTGSKYRGIGVYSRELVKELLNIDADNEYHFLNMYGIYENDPESNKQCFVHDYFTGPKCVDVGERQLFRDDRLNNLLEAQTKHFLEQSGIDIMLFTSPNEYGGMFKAEWFEGVFKVGILYDLIPLIFPEQCLFDETYSDDYNRSIEFLKGLDLLLAISQSAKEDAIRLLGIPEEKIVVVYAGIDNDFKKIDKIDKIQIKKKYNIKDNFILFAGGIDFKKNIEGLIKAFSKVDNSLINKYQLIITGKASPDLMEHYLQEAAKAGVQDKVSCTGFIAKDDLVSLYNMAEVFVFPSLYEGFGLPVIEAMACGTKVITSNCSSLKEIAEGHAVLVDPTSVKSITKGIQNTLKNSKNLQQDAERTIEYAKSFNWKRTTKLAYEAIKKNYVVKESGSNYNFKVMDSLLNNISLVYAQKGLDFSLDDMNSVAKELLHIANHDGNIVRNNKYRIIYDVTVVHEWLKAGYVTGIGRVSKELYIALSQIVNVVPVIMSGKNNTLSYSSISMNNYEIISKDVILNKDDIYLMPELQLRGIQVKNNHPHAKQLQDMGIKCYAVIFDILPIRMPQYFEEKTSASFDAYIRELVNNFDGLLCGSKTVYEDVAAYCLEKEIFNERNEVLLSYFHYGQNSFKMQNDKNISYALQKFVSTDDNVFLMVGTIEPRKGHELILQLFEEKWENKSTDKLCIIGRLGWSMERFVNKLKNHPKLGERFMFFEDATDQDVAYAYKNCTGLIQASAGEGFGLPLIEAGHYNLPILCSDIPVFHEVGEDNVLYFDRENRQSIYECLEKFKALKSEGKLPRSSNIKLMNWSDTAHTIYNMIAKKKDWHGKIRKNGEIVSCGCVEE